MARLRAKESAARDSFRLAVERYIPNNVLAALGLTTLPPHCVISVPQPDAGLAAVTPDDLKRAPAPQQARRLHDCRLTEVLAPPWHACDTLYIPLPCWAALNTAACCQSGIICSIVDDYGGCITNCFWVSMIAAIRVFRTTAELSTVLSTAQ